MEYNSTWNERIFEKGGKVWNHINFVTEIKEVKSIS